MPFTSVQDLRSTVKRQSHRNDIDDAQINDFIAQCENEIYANELNILQVREMEARATANTGSDRFLALPDNFLMMRRLKLNIDGEPDVRFRAPDQMIIKPTGLPKFFTVTSQLEFDRIPSSTYEVEMQYLMKAAPLSEAAPSNFVLANYPNIYLYGTLSKLFEWAMDEQRAEFYRGKFLASIAGANKQTKKGNYGPAPYMRIDLGSTP
jgi:hypothetical protein